MKKLLLSFLLFLSFLCNAQQSIIVGPQNDCGTKGISKNIHTSSNWFDVSGVAKLKITTIQHRTYDKSRIYNESGNLIWEWGGESLYDTWYEKVHIVAIKENKIRVEFYQGFSDPFCNGLIKVEKVSNENNLIVNSKLIEGKTSAAKATENNNPSGVLNTNERIITNNFSSSTVGDNKKEFEKLILKFNNTNSTNSTFSGYVKPYPPTPSDSYYKQDYYNNQLIYDGYMKKVVTSTNGNTVYQDVFKHGKGKEYIINSNGYLDGYFLNGKLNGYGEHVSNGNGFSYKGYFINGERNGEGILVMDGLKGATKYIYEGTFKNGKYNGEGTITYNFMSYTGSFVNGEISGSGVYLYPNGSKYVGNSVNGKYEGNGEYYFADGNYYVGNFSNGTLNGLGEYTSVNGTKRKGVWQNGNYVDETIKVASPNIANNQPRSSSIEGRTSAAKATENSASQKTEKSDNALANYLLGLIIDDALSSSSQSSSGNTKTKNNSGKSVGKKCEYCGNRFSDIGYSIYLNEIIQGKHKDLLVVQLTGELLGDKGETDNVGRYCKRKCAVDAYNSGARDNR